MRRLIVLALLLMTACTVTVSPIPKPTDVPTATPMVEDPPLPLAPTSTLEPTMVPTEVDDEVPVYFWLLLGGDYRSHRYGTQWGDKTDVMLMVATVMTEPVRIYVFHFPRNFYQEVESFPDMWLFHVYGQEGFPGLHYYWQEVFNVPLSGAFYVNMDNFVQIVDKAAPSGIPIRRAHDVKKMDGEAILEYLRDNENMWGCGAYRQDCENRQFWVLRSLAVYFQNMLTDSPSLAATTILDSYDRLFETDISEIGQFVWLANLGYRIRADGWEQVGIFKLSDSKYVEYTDTPFPVRGFVPVDEFDLHDWVWSILEGPY